MNQTTTTTTPPDINTLSKCIGIVHPCDASATVYCKEEPCNIGAYCETCAVKLHEVERLMSHVLFRRTHLMYCDFNKAEGCPNIAVLNCPQCLGMQTCQSCFTGFHRVRAQHQPITIEVADHFPLLSTPPRPPNNGDNGDNGDNRDQHEDHDQQQEYSGPPIDDPVIGSVAESVAGIVHNNNNNNNLDDAHQTLHDHPHPQFPTSQLDIDYENQHRHQPNKPQPFSQTGHFYSRYQKGLFFNESPLISEEEENELNARAGGRMTPGTAAQADKYLNLSSQNTSPSSEKYMPFSEHSLPPPPPLVKPNAPPTVIVASSFSSQPQTKPPPPIQQQKVIGTSAGPAPISKQTTRNEPNVSAFLSAYTAQTGAFSQLPGLNLAAQMTNLDQYAKKRAAAATQATLSPRTKKAAPNPHAASGQK